MKAINTNILTQLREIF